MDTYFPLLYTSVYTFFYIMITFVAVSAAAFFLDIYICGYIFCSYLFLCIHLYAQFLPKTPEGFCKIRILSVQNAILLGGSLPLKPLGMYSCMYWHVSFSGMFIPFLHHSLDPRIDDLCT